MPNIALTTYCNLHCPYCFADTMIQTEDIKNISIDQFKNILEWVLKDIPKDIANEIPAHIGLIGGEPTLHPNFKEILQTFSDFSKKYLIEGVLFTNGIYLEEYIPYIPKNMGILINVNTPNAMSITQWEKLNNTLDVLFSLGWLSNSNTKNSLGCNLCMEIDDYNFIWNIIDKYKINRLRVSVTAPTKLEYQLDKDKYYTTMIPKFLNFVKEAEKRNVILRADCNQIPLCYYENQEDLSLINKVVQKNVQSNNAHCGPIVDITPDFKASACFGAYETVDCTLFDTYFQLEYYLLHNFIIPKMKKNYGGKCKDCKDHELLKCQGGCLSFAK